MAFPSYSGLGQAGGLNLQIPAAFIHLQFSFGYFGTSKISIVLLSFMKRDKLMVP